MGLKGRKQQKLEGTECEVKLYLHCSGWPDYSIIRPSGHGANRRCACQPAIDYDHGHAWSRHLSLPVQLAEPVCRPTAAAAAEVLAVGDQGLMPMAS